MVPGTPGPVRVGSRGSLAPRRCSWTAVAEHPRPREREDDHVRHASGAAAEAREARRAGHRPGGRRPPDPHVGHLGQPQPGAEHHHRVEADGPHHPARRPVVRRRRGRQLPADGRTHRGEHRLGALRPRRPLEGGGGHLRRRADRRGGRPGGGHGRPGRPVGGPGGPGRRPQEPGPGQDPGPVRRPRRGSGVVFAGAQPAPAAGGQDPVELLAKLQELHQQGVVSDEEFEAQKKRLLGG